MERVSVIYPSNFRDVKYIWWCMHVLFWFTVILERVKQCSRAVGQYFPFVVVPWEWQELVRFFKICCKHSISHWLKMMHDIQGKNDSHMHIISFPWQRWNLLCWTISDRNPCHSPARNVIITKKQITTTTGICRHTVTDNIGNNPSVG
jgi:hypothetical protein